MDSHITRSTIKSIHPCAVPTIQQVFFFQRRIEYDQAIKGNKQL